MSEKLGFWLPVLSREVVNVVRVQCCQQSKVMIIMVDAILLVAFRRGWMTVALVT